MHNWKKWKLAVIPTWSIVWVLRGMDKAGYLSRFRMQSPEFCKEKTLPYSFAYSLFFSAFFNLLFLPIVMLLMLSSGMNAFLPNYCVVCKVILPSYIDTMLRSNDLMMIGKCDLIIGILILQHKHLNICSAWSTKLWIRWHPIAWRILKYRIYAQSNMHIWNIVSFLSFVL